ncbi:MAG: hypothetical protein R3B82_21495 [Sandaracinaceae bacterium]
MEVQNQLGDEAFWRFHDTMFENQQQLSREEPRAVGGALRAT